MDKISALRLRPGDRIWFGDTRCMKDNRSRGRGIVMGVTPGGAIITEVIPEGEPMIPALFRKAWNDFDWEERLVPYHHVNRWEPGR
jgi:hypothetical protein